MQGGNSRSDATTPFFGKRTTFGCVAPEDLFFVLFEPRPSAKTNKQIRLRDLARAKRSRLRDGKHRTETRPRDSSEKLRSRFEISPWYHLSPLFWGNRQSLWFGWGCLVLSQYSLQVVPHFSQPVDWASKRARARGHYHKVTWSKLAVSERVRILPSQVSY